MLRTWVINFAICIVSASHVKMIIDKLHAYHSLNLSFLVIISTVLIMTKKLKLSETTDKLYTQCSSS